MHSLFIVPNKSIRGMLFEILIDFGVANPGPDVERLALRLEQLGHFFAFLTEHQAEVMGLLDATSHRAAARAFQAERRRMGESLFQLHKALSNDALYPLYLMFARLVAEILTLLRQQETEFKPAILKHASVESLKAAQQIARYQGTDEKRNRHLAFALRYINTSHDWRVVEARTKGRAMKDHASVKTKAIDGVYEMYAAENFEAFLVSAGVPSERANSIAQATCIQHIRYQQDCIRIKIHSNDPFFDTPGYWDFYLDDVWRNMTDMHGQAVEYNSQWTHRGILHRFRDASGHEQIVERCFRGSEMVLTITKYGVSTVHRFKRTAETPSES